MPARHWRAGKQEESWAVGRGTALPIVLRHQFRVLEGGPRDRRTRDGDGGGRSERMLIVTYALEGSPGSAGDGCAGRVRRSDRTACPHNRQKMPLLPFAPDGRGAKMGEHSDRGDGWPSGIE